MWYLQLTIRYHYHVSIFPHVALTLKWAQAVVVAFIYSRLLNRHKKSTSRVPTGEEEGNNVMWRKRREGGSIKHFAVWRRSTDINTKDCQGLIQATALVRLKLIFLPLGISLFNVAHLFTMLMATKLCLRFLNFAQGLSYGFQSRKNGWNHSTLKDD